MEGLGFDNILGEQEIDTLFSDPDDEKVEGQDTDQEDPEIEKEKQETTEVVDPNLLFEDEDDQPESVGSGDNEAEEKEDTVHNEGSDTSPNENFYSSIASACAVDGVFPNLDEETIKNAKDAEAFSDLIEAEVNARLDEKQQRISKALENGVEPSNIQLYENTLSYINSINDAAIAEDSEKGEQLRYNIIYQDFLNKGYSKEKAKKFTERTIDAGTDIEDAKEALQSNREYFQGEYNNLLKEAQKEADKERAERKKQAEALKESLMNGKDLMGNMELTNDIRKKTFDNISKPIYKDPNTGEYMTAIQKYEMEHRGDFLKYAGLFYTLTNGFTDFESLVKGEVKKKMKKGLRELEQTLSNTRRSPNGGLRMVGSRKEDPESFATKGFKLDL